MASIEESHQMVAHLEDEGFFVSLLVRRSEILKPFSHTMFFRSSWQRKTS